MSHLIRSLACLAVVALSSAAWANGAPFPRPLPPNPAPPKPPTSQPTTQPAKAAPASANPHAALIIGLGLSAALAGGGLWLAHAARRGGR